MSDQIAGTALQRLQVLLDKAKAKTKSNGTLLKAQAVATTLRGCHQQFTTACEQAQAERPDLSREIEAIDQEEVQLRGLSKQAERVKGQIAAEEYRALEVEVQTARETLQGRKERALARMSRLTEELVTSENGLRVALESYAHARRTMVKDDPMLLPQFADVDAMVAAFAARTPMGRARALREEVLATEAHFGDLSPREQYFQLRIWLGTFRQLQEELPNLDPAEVGPTDISQFESIFGRLVGLSREHHPGYIEEFRTGTKADWPAYIASAREGLRDAVMDPNRMAGKI